MGAVIFGFGILKYFPGVSPAESLVLATTEMLTFGLLPGKVAMVLFATAECAIGLSLMLGRGLRVTRYLLVLWALGILSPLVLMTSELFMGPYHAPTLAGQYVLKDVILLTASLVIATTLSHVQHNTEHPPTRSPDEVRLSRANTRGGPKRPAPAAHTSPGRGASLAGAGAASPWSRPPRMRPMRAEPPRHILVTGGAGFVGSHVADLLAEQGATVRILDVLLPAAHRGRPDYLGDHEMIEGDVRDSAVLDRALVDVDAVCHQAAMVGLGVGVADMPGYVANNDLGTAQLLAAMDRHGVGTLVLASSMVVYGEGRYSCAEHGLVRPPARAATDLAAGRFDPRCPVCATPLEPGLVPEDAAPDPRNTYAATKLTQEHLAATWARETGGTTLALRYHNIYGPRMPRNTPYAGVASIFRSALALGQAPQVFEDGAQQRDFVHVHDVAAANLAALDYPGRGFVAFNICSGQPHTIADMATALAQACDGPPPQITGRFRLGDVRHILASPERAATELGFRAKTSFTEGMAEFATAPLRD